MVTFIRNAYRMVVEISLWLIPISFIVIGYQIGNDLRGTDHPFLGAILGLAVGIYIGGFIATILKIDENLEIIKNNSLRVEISEAKVPKTEVSSSDSLGLVAKTKSDPLGLS